MTLRERIADWISGGKIERLESAVEFERGLIAMKDSEKEDITMKALLFQQALVTISYMETPGAAPTAKKMAAVAKEALGRTDSSVKVKP